MAGSSDLSALRAAEREALRTIEAARQSRRQQLQAAEAEARRELAEFERVQRERLQQSHPQGAITEERKGQLEAATTADIEEMQRKFEANKEAALSVLESVVMKTAE